MSRELKRCYQLFSMWTACHDYDSVRSQRCTRVLVLDRCWIVMFSYRLDVTCVSVKQLVVEGASGC